MIRRILFLLLLMSATRERVNGSEAWGVIGGNSTSIRLNRINTSTGEVSTLSQSGGALLFANVDDLASDPIRHPTLVWAVRTSIAGNELIAVDPYREEIISYAVLDTPSSVFSLAIDPLTGIMFGASSDALYTINPATGMSNLVGTTNAPITKGLGFDASGRLFGIEGQNRLVEVDTMNAATSLIAELALTRMEDIAVRPEDGVMFGLGYGDYQLFTIDVDDGTIVSVGDSLFRPSGLAFTGVPEPTTLSLLAASFLCLVTNMRNKLSRF